MAVLSVLDLQAMPRGARSRTRRLHDAFFEALRLRAPDARIVTRDLVKDVDQLPAIDEWDVEAKFEVAYGSGRLDERGAARWEAVTRLTDELHGAGLVVISTPMWNFSVPWMLKRWIDAVVQARLTFEYVDGSFQGLLAGRRAVILASRDGAYPPGSPWAGIDFQLPYLKHILGFVGITEVDVVVAEPMVLMGPEAGAQALDGAVRAAGELGRSLPLPR